EKELGGSPVSSAPVSRPRPKTDPSQLSDVALATYAGAYRSTELDATFKLSVQNGSLMLRMNWTRSLKLDPSARDEFQASGILLAFRRNSEHITGFDLSEGRVRNVRFDKID